MATGSTSNYSLPYPLSTDPVNVSGDIEQLSTKIDNDLQEIIEDTSALMWTTGGTFTNGLQAPTYNDTTGKMSMSLSQNLQTSASPTFEALTTSGNLTVNGNIVSGTWAATTIAANRGGTGLTSYAVGDIIYASASTTLAKLAGVATGNALISGGVGTAPSWGKIGLTTHVSGTLGVANGGTGVTASTGSASVVLSNSPALTGTPTAPTAANGTNTTQIATTQFVQTAVSTLGGLPSQTGNAGKFLSTDGTNASWQIVDLSSKANINSPTFTGVPAAPTAAAGTNTTQLATTAFVTTADNLKANLASPTFTGVPAAPTAAAGTNTTQLATTAFVTAAVGTRAALTGATFTGTVTVVSPSAAGSKGAREITMSTSNPSGGADGDVWLVYS